MNASLSLFVWLMYKNLVLSLGLTVKSLSRNTSLKRRPIELIPAGGKDWILKKNQYSSTWKHNYDKSTELNGWHYCKKVSAVFYCVLYALTHDFQCFLCRLLFGLWKWVTRIQKKDRRVRIVSDARGVGWGWGDEDECSGFLSAIPLVNVPFPTLTLFSNKQFLWRLFKCKNFSNKVK